jgi:EpsI family protein
LLQLHRPEVCYPAVGFEVDAKDEVRVPLAGGVTMPAVALATHAGSRREDVLYWTRLGEYLPMDMSEQRRDRLRTAMAGYIADGVLFRASSLRTGPKPEFPVLAEFSGALLAAMPRVADRAALIGTANAKATVARA